MKCFPFCSKGKVKPANKIKPSKGRINVLPANADGRTGADYRGRKDVGNENGDFEYVVCSYETLDSDRKYSNCIQEILSSSSSLNKLRKDRNESLRNCYSETEIAEEGANAESPSFGNLKKMCQNQELKKENLGSLGRRVKLSRSLQDHIQEAKRKHLPPLYGSNKKDRGESDKKSGVRKSIGGKAGAGLVFVKKPDNTEDRILLGNAKNSFVKQTLLLDLTLPKMLYQETRNASESKRGSELDEWNSIEDILSMDVSSGARKCNQNKKIAEERVTTTELQTKFSLKSFRITESQSRMVNSLANEGKNQAAVRQEGDLTIHYNDDEIELMEDIENQFFAK